MKTFSRFLCLTFILLAASHSGLTGDWPTYKGNIYFTGNNDELVIKKGALKWLYQGTHVMQNPIVSGNRVYAVDSGKEIHCLNIDSGKLIWKMNVANLVAGKSKGALRYPLVTGDRLVLCDSTTIYCFDKYTGKAIWARVGSPDDVPKASVLDGIYAVPVIHGDAVLYGTRNVFVSRDINHGRVLWANGAIKTYSGFPSFYDKYVFTQSMDYVAGRYAVICLLGNSGKVEWEKEFPKPHRIFSPVVYREKVFLPVSETLHCLKAADGVEAWSKKYDDLITSNPSFTEQEILFTAGNRSVLVIDPADGSVKRKIDAGDQSSPSFVTIQDQIYIAKMIKKKVGDAMLSFAEVNAYRMDEDAPLWTFTAPFDGAPTQPAASRGLLIVPAGKCLYAVGVPYGAADEDGTVIADITGDDKIDTVSGKDKTADTPEGDGKLPETKLRDLDLAVIDKGGKELPSTVEVIQWDRGKEAYKDKLKISGKEGKIKVPEGDNVEINFHTPGHMPRKIVLSKDDAARKVTLDKIEKGRSFVVDNIIFEINEAYLLPESLPILNRLLEMLRQNPSMRVEVRGYTDSTGTREHNLVLSRRRARAVMQYLVQNGISPLRVTAAGFGPDNPVADNDTAAGRRRNRRTEFFIIEE